jgi:hypothetical protein
MLFDNGVGLHFHQREHHLLSGRRVDVHARENPVVRTLAFIDEVVRHGLVSGPATGLARAIETASL